MKKIDLKDKLKDVWARATVVNKDTDTGLDPQLDRLKESPYSPIIIAVVCSFLFGLGLTVGHYIL